MAGSRLKAVLWDNDGVLVDTEPLYFRATREALAKGGVDLSRELFAEISLAKGRSAFELLAGRGATVEQIEELRAERDRAYGRLLRSDRLVNDGIEDALSTLRGRLRMAVVTSSRKDHFEVIHAASGLLPYFDLILTREDYERTKPHPEPYLTALRRLGLNAGECIAVEDSERGLLSARAAGLRCIAVPTELTRSGDFSSAHAIASGIAEIVAEIERLLGN